MSKIKILQMSDKNKNSGYLEIKNQTSDSADLYLYGDIVTESWQSEWYEDDVCPKDVVEFLAQLDGVNTIHVHINSGGGAVFAGIAIGNQLKQHQAETIGHIEGIAASISGVIPMYLDRVIVHPGAMFMMHKPLTGVWGNADDIRKTADVLDQCQKTIITMYMSKTREGVKEETIEQMVNQETWLTAEELVTYFDVELVEGMPIAACESQFFDKYKNMPKNTKDQNGGELPAAFDLDKLAEAVAEKVKNLSVIDYDEEKNKLLEDLDYI